VIYVFANDDRGLTAYASEEAAISACEGVDVEDGNYRFFSSGGQPLLPRITRPTTRSFGLVTSGLYDLRHDVNPTSAHLTSILSQVTYVEGCGLTNVTEVMAHMERHINATAHAPSNKSLERTRDR
jgi:hypothetical protein